MDHRELKDLDRTLARLHEEDLGAWDRGFVDDMIRRVAKAEETGTEWDFNLTPRQWEQLERMKDQYL